VEHDAVGLLLMSCLVVPGTLATIVRLSRADLTGGLETRTWFPPTRRLDFTSTRAEKLT
jgi:hypothetical protein